MKVVVAEKPSVARELAAVLGANQRHEGYFEGGGYQVAWALGHLVELCEPEDYDPALRKWSLEGLPIIPDQFRLRVIDAPAAKRQFAILRRLLQDADEIIAATDAGREGELIFRYILEKAGFARTPFRRLWLKSLNPAAVRSALQSMRPGADYNALYAAARCRNQADWIVGLNATRNFTVRYGGPGVLWSVGRVQTPVLALIAARDDEIRAFRPETFYELWTTYRNAAFKHAAERFNKEEEATAFLARVAGHPFEVTKIEAKRRVEQPPQLYDLTDLQRDMNRRYGLTADHVLKAAQKLYEAKAITYPRTDSRYITRDMKPDVRATLSRLAAHKSAEIGKLHLDALPFSARVVNDSKVTDHHAILPTGNWPKALSGAETKVFDAVVTRLIAAFYPPCIKRLTTVHGEANRIPFRAVGVQVIDPGWTELYPARAPKDRRPRQDAPSDEHTTAPQGTNRDDQPLPDFKPGERGPHQPHVKQGETKPPPHFTENTLLAAMETAGRLVDDDALKEALKERGLGTPATRAAIIETLLARGYIARENKNLVATDPGRYLIALVRDPRLKSAELTGDWEARLKRIERNELDPLEFMADIVRHTGEIIEEDGHSQIDPTQLGPCPRCGSPVIAGKRDYGCSRWRDGCSFVLAREFEGVALSADQVRILLQRRSLAWPSPGSDEGESLLYLSDAGAVFRLPKPRPNATRFSRKKGLGKRRSNVKSASSAQPTAAEKSPSGDRRVSRRPAATGDQRGGQVSGPARKAMAGDASISSEKRHAGGSLGVCPLCGREVVEQKKSFSCSGWREGCPLVIWKTMAGKRISRRMAQTLLTKGVTGRLKGFKSKAGKPFDARLQLEGGRVQFTFEPSE